MVFLICILLDGAIGLIVGIVVALLRNADRVNTDYVLLERYDDANKEEDFRINPRTFPDMRDDLVSYLMKTKVSTFDEKVIRADDRIVLNFAG